MQKELLQSVLGNYDTLLPQNKEVVLLLITLQNKIDKQEIEDPFTQRDFEDAIDEVSNILHRGQTIQKESISRKLSQFYYTTLKKGNEYRYQLTVFARDLVRIIINEMEPQFEETELIHTFRRTLKMEREDLTSIKNFEYWFRQHYEPSKRIILAHSENLQRLVDAKTMALRTLLKSEITSTKELITRFIEIFEGLGKQTDGLTETLNFKLEIIDNIKDAEKNFLDKKEDWESYTKIRHEVEKFFDNIDSRVLSINDRIQLSTSRLRALYETLQYKQLFKLKIEKFLHYLLKNSKWTNDAVVVLPENIANRKIPYFREKYTKIPSLNFTEVTPRDVPEMEEDAEYKKKKEAENMRVLNRQESVTQWLESINASLAKGEDFIYEKWFKDMYAKEKNLEVPIDVCFNLIQKYNRNKEMDIVIDQQKPFKAKDDLALWKMKITRSNS
jgi:ferritin-like metal-binding protein YciE